MNVELHHAQNEFLFSKAPSTGLVAGLGSGKSYIATLKTIIIKLNNPHLRVAYYLPTVPLIKDIAFIKFPEMLTDMGLEYVLNKSDKEIHIEGMGTIIFRSMSNPETIVGYEVYYSLIDEVDILPQAVMQTAFDKIIARNRQKGPERNKLDVVGTPEGFKFFYKRFVEDIKPDDRLIVARTYDNKFLPADYIETLEGQYTPELLQAYLEGKFVNLRSGAVYGYFNRETHHRDIEPEDNELIHVSMDFNVGGCAMSCSVIRNNIPKTFCELAPKDTMTAITDLKELFPERDVVIYPDASGRAASTNASRSDISLLEEAGFMVDAPMSNPKIEDRVNSVNINFHHNKAHIDTNKCPRLTKALEQQAYDDKGKPEKYPGSATIDDWSDSYGYFINRKFGITRSKVSVTTRRMV